MGRLKNRDLHTLPLPAPVGESPDAVDLAADEEATSPLTERRAIVCQRIARSIARLAFDAHGPLDPAAHTEIQRQAARLYETARFHSGIRTSIGREPAESYDASALRTACSIAITSVVLERPHLRIGAALILPDGRLVDLASLVAELAAATPNAHAVAHDRARQIVDGAETRTIPLPFQPVAAANATNVAPGLERLLGDLAKIKAQRPSR